MSEDLPPINGTYIDNQPQEPAPIEARPLRVVHTDSHRPPYDTGAERGLLGAALLREEAADLVAQNDPGIFWHPTHREIATAIGYLRNKGMAVDVATARAEVTRRNPETQVANSLFIELVAEVPSSRNAESYLAILKECARDREFMAAGHSIIEASAKGDAETVLETVGSLKVISEQVEFNSWQPVDFTAIFDQGIEPPAPTMLRRVDNFPLIYPNKIHAFNAESESGKSWLALYACKQELEEGNEILYIDCEEEARAIASRLIALGVHPDAIAEQFHYIRPDDPFSAQALAVIESLIETYRPSLCIVDGITELMVMNGWKIDKNDDAALMLNKVMRPIERDGVAVVMIDHLPKNIESQGLYAIGAQHKRAGITGASYKLGVLEPFGKGKIGRAKITVTKDKHGAIRGEALEGTWIADFIVNSKDDLVQCELAVPNAATEIWPTFLMERASRILELDGPMATGKWEKLIKGNASDRRVAVSLLVKHGYVEKRQGGRATMNHSIKNYRQMAPEPDDGVEF